MTCLLFSKELLWMIFKNLKFQHHLFDRPDIAELVFPDGASYYDWVDKPRETYLKPSDWNPSPMAEYGRLM